MNIFRLDNDPNISATYHCDKHMKMILEQTQLLHTALRQFGCTANWLYKPFNPKHPSCLWARETRSNFKWLVSHGKALCAEYTVRYGKIHKCSPLIDLAENESHLIPDGPETKQLLAMPDQYKNDDVVHSYKLYYAAVKYIFAKWKPPSEEPNWWQEYRDYVIKNNLESKNTKNNGIDFLLKLKWT
jgi:hypothetical protein